MPCEHGNWLRRCGRPEIGVCVYCGRAFCAQHGELLPQEHQVCSRQRCQTRYWDVLRFQEYKAQVKDRNGGARCGVQGCPAPLWGQCSKCEGVFCAHHLSSKQERLRVGRAIRTRPVSVCDHCARRLELWAP